MTYNEHAHWTAYQYMPLVMAVYKVLWQYFLQIVFIHHCCSDKVCEIFIIAYHWRYPELIFLWNSLCSMMTDMITISDFLLFDSVWLITARTVHVYCSCSEANDQFVMRIHGTCFKVVIYSQQNTMLSMKLLPNFQAYFKFDVFSAGCILVKLPWIFPGAPLKFPMESTCASFVATT